MNDRLNLVCVCCLGFICVAAIVGIVVQEVAGQGQSAPLIAVASLCAGSIATFLQHKPAVNPQAPAPPLAGRSPVTTGG